jgi:hypothetical protein
VVHASARAGSSATTELHDAALLLADLEANAKRMADSLAYISGGLKVNLHALHGALCTINSAINPSLCHASHISGGLKVNLHSLHVSQV